MVSLERRRRRLRSAIFSEQLMDAEPCPKLRANKRLDPLSPVNRQQSLLLPLSMRMPISKNGQHACSSCVISASASQISELHANSKSYPSGNSRMAASEECCNTASSWWRTLCSLESAVTNNWNWAAYFLKEDKRTTSPATTSAPPPQGSARVAGH